MNKIPAVTTTILFLFFFSCQKLEDMARENWKERTQVKPVSEEDIEEWKERLALDEAEIQELDKKIRQMVKKTKKAGGLSWKIAQAYMKVGNYELGIRHYNQALHESAGKKVEVIGSEVHFFESAIPYFDKTLVYQSPNKQLLFETGLAYANAARDRGWENTRRATAIEIFEFLARENPNDSRFPYQLALIYFDSSIAAGIGGIESPYDDQEKGMKLLNAILRKEPKNVPVRFARANFLYRSGQTQAAKSEYLQIKKILETLKEEGRISESLDKNDSYRNVTRNLQLLEKGGN